MEKFWTTEQNWYSCKSKTELLSTINSISVLWIQLKLIQGKMYNLESWSNSPRIVCIQAEYIHMSIEVSHIRLYAVRNRHLRTLIGGRAGAKLMVAKDTFCIFSGTKPIRIIAAFVIPDRFPIKIWVVKSNDDEDIIVSLPKLD